jgi:ABC-type dipeptide/oligopeptide/nickel transport system permease component
VAAYVVRRLGLTVLVLIGVSLFTFLLLHSIPGNPALVMLGVLATPASIRQMDAAWGFNRPLPVQYVSYLIQVLHGNLGESIFLHQPVATLVMQAFPATVELALGAFIVTVLISVPLGVGAAVRKGSLVDVVSMLFAQAGTAMPVFWTGILLIMLLAVSWGVLPPFGYGYGFAAALSSLLHTGSLADFGSLFTHLAMPAFTLGVAGAALTARIIRSSMLDVMRQDYIRTARAKGLGAFAVLIRHTFRNALLPIVTVVGLQFSVLLGGAIITENVFAWPGVGRLVVNAISSRDYPLVQGCVLVIALLVTFVNLIVDLLYTQLDPRIRYE